MYEDSQRLGQNFESARAKNDKQLSLFFCQYLKNSIRYSWFDRKDAYLGGHAPNGPTLTQADPFICASNFATYVLVTILTISIDISDNTQCARMDLNKRFLPKPMTTTG